VSNKRVDLKKILADSDLRRKLMVSAIRATQAREGIQTTDAQAKRAYYVVTEGEKTAFFDLEKFKSGKGEDERRHEMFVQTLLGTATRIRSDIARRDFSAIEGSPLAYNRLAPIAHFFREFPATGSLADIHQGVITGVDDPYIRCFWEVTPTMNLRPWKPLHKGGEFSRFYYDPYLVLDWSDEAQREFHRLRDPKIYFRAGLTWPRRTQKGFNLRRMAANCVFSDKGPAIFFEDPNMERYFLGVANSALAEFVMQALSSFGSWELTVIRRFPLAQPTGKEREVVASLAEQIFDRKSRWDVGNEISTQFTTPWVLQTDIVHPDQTLFDRLSVLQEHETNQDTTIQRLYDDLNTAVYRLYGIPDGAKQLIENALGVRPQEMIWPQMEGKTRDQKRMDHVWRLLAYAVKWVVDADEDGLVPLLHVSGEAPLLDRVHAELGKMFATRDVNEVEVEIVNELKRKVKAYDRADSIRQWLEDNYFAYHASMYKNRPIYWHISSRQGRGPAAFSALVHYHRFDKDRMAKLRGVYLREALGVFRREAALAGQQGRAEDRLEWQAKVEEAEELDRRLQRVQEGFHQGTEDYRISTPWKTEKERPKGWDPDINDGVKVNIEPLQRAGVLRIPEVV
jgi:hypothetical protein